VWLIAFNQAAPDELFKHQENFRMAILMLEDGTVFHGRAAGHIGTTTGEICFNTGMTGYQEIFTDPSYYGQVLVNTNVHIGNYGISDAEVESDSIKISGLVVHDFQVEYSRLKAQTNIKDYLERHQLVAIEQVDTRAIVQHIRERGAMNCVISSDTTDQEMLRHILHETASMQGLELSSHVTTKQAYALGAEDAKYRVAVLDYGVKKNILRCLVERGCYLQVFPAKAAFADIQAWKPDAYFVSNGPGDPGAMDYAVETISTVIGTGKPVFGICLGQQLIARAAGIGTYKLHHGHRGLNHPVLNLETKRGEITSQNHGFGVVEQQVYDSPSILTATHINLNDQTVEGIRLKDKPVFSVQYHPESSPGPHDSRYLFDEFVGMMRN
jgi:carbamoyl-phosphate synthase small subunit